MCWTLFRRTINTGVNNFPKRWHTFLSFFFFKPSTSLAVIYSIYDFSWKFNIISNILSLFLIKALYLWWPLSWLLRQYWRIFRLHLVSTLLMLALIIINAIHACLDSPTYLPISLFRIPFLFAFHSFPLVVSFSLKQCLQWESVGKLFSCENTLFHPKSWIMI